MISGFDADQLFGFRESIHEGFEFSGGRNWSRAPLTKSLGFARRGGIRNRSCGLSNWRVGGGQAQGDQCGNAVVGIGGAQANGGSERKSGENDGEREFAFQPVERGADVFDFANAVGVLAFAQTGAAKVEAEHGKSKAVQRLHGVEDDFVVQRSSIERMRMADQGGMGCVGEPALSRASRRPAGPSRKSERMVVFGDHEPEYNSCQLALRSPVETRVAASPAAE